MFLFSAVPLQFQIRISMAQPQVNALSNNLAFNGHMLNWDTRAEKALRRNIKNALTSFRSVFKLIEAYKQSDEPKDLMSKTSQSSRKHAFITEKGHALGYDEETRTLSCMSKQSEKRKKRQTPTNFVKSFPQQSGFT